MHISRFTPDDTEAVAAAVELTNTARKVDAPFDHPFTPAGYSAMLRHGWDGETPETYAAWDRDRCAGVVTIWASEWDNKHLAWLQVLVHPDLRGAGRGSEMLAFAESRTRELGRTSLGIDGWDVPATHGFAAAHELPRKGSAIKRRQVLEQVDRGLVDELHSTASAAAASYELVRITGHTPPDLLDAVAELTGSINDAPTDDLDIEDEVFPTDRIRGYENAMIDGRGMRLYRVLARHRDTGELAGHTVVAVESERPWIADQHDTSVAAAHRGHRLGLLLKTDMLRWLASEEPGVATIDTWNMESNGFMIEVNEKLGYQVLGREIDFQRDVR